MPEPSIEPVVKPAVEPAPVTGRVTFYWRPGCGFCSSLKRALTRSQVDLDERNIWEDEEAASFVRSVAGGNETVPTVVVGGRAMVNPTADEVVALVR